MNKEAHHRGYLIEGEKKGEALILRVTPTRAGLPNLPYRRFHTVRASWAKAVCDVAKYIDDALAGIDKGSYSWALASASILLL